MEKIKRFLKTVFIYFIGSVLSKLVSFFLLPLYTSKIDPGQYGTYDLVLSFINLIAPVAFFQIWDGMFRFSFDCIDEQNKRKIISNSFFVYLFGIIIYSLIFVCLNLYYNFDYFEIIFIYGLFFAFQYFFTYIARVYMNNKLFVISGAINSLITAIINIILILYFKWDVKSLYFSPIIGCAVQILIIELRLHIIRKISFKLIEKKILRDLLRFSIPLCFATISYWLLNGFTKIIINNRLGSDDNGYYAVANRFGSMITILITVFQYAWNESAYLMANEKNKISNYNYCIDLLLSSVFILNSIVIIGIKIIFPWFINSAYDNAIYIIPAVITGVAMNSMAGILGTLFMTEKKTNFILISTLISAVVNITLAELLVDNYGIHGIVISLAFSFFLLMVMRLIKLKHSFSIEIKWYRFLNLIPMILSIILFYKVNKLIYLFLTLFILTIVLAINLKKYIILIIKKKDGKQNENI